MTNKYLTSFALILVLGLSFSLVAQRRTTTTRARNTNHTIAARAGENVTSVATRANVSPDELALANGLTINARLRKGQRLIVPKSASTAETSPRPSGEIIGKRILFADGGSLNVDDVWKQGDTIWYRLNGTSQSLNRTIQAIEDRFKEVPSTTSLASPPTITKKTEAAPAVTWIYLVDGARIRVDEVREVSDGAWYNRGKLAIFLDRERIARIERDDPATASGDWKQIGWSSGNPRIDQLIHKNASRVGIDPYLVFLVIEQESHFRTQAVSPKGARGLMQLMPGTARRFGVSRPFDPADNIRGGTQYLKQLLTMFNGRVDLALASYNAGEGRVIEYGNRVPPFRETRNYVMRIGKRYRQDNRSTAADPN